jgi:hypothetical protein
MDLFKSTFADSKAEVELVIKPVSIGLITPPHQPVLVYLSFVRESKTMFTTSKYTLQPMVQQGMTKLVLNDGDMFKTVNKYYANKSR